MKYNESSKIIRTVLYLLLKRNLFERNIEDIAKYEKFLEEKIKLFFEGSWKVWLCGYEKSERFFCEIEGEWLTLEDPSELELFRIHLILNIIMCTGLILIPTIDEFGINPIRQHMIKQLKFLYDAMTPVAQTMNEIQQLKSIERLGDFNASDQADIIFYSLSRSFSVEEKDRSLSQIAQFLREIVFYFPNNTIWLSHLNVAFPNHPQMFHQRVPFPKLRDLYTGLLVTDREEIQKVYPNYDKAIQFFFYSKVSGIDVPVINIPRSLQSSYKPIHLVDQDKFLSSSSLLSSRMIKTTSSSSSMTTLSRFIYGHTFGNKICKPTTS